MARGRPSPCLGFLSPAERGPLEHWQRATTIPAGRAKRAHSILLRAAGLALSAMARRLAVGRRIVRAWRKRFRNQRVAGLTDQVGRGCQPMFAPEVAVPLVQLACARPDLRGRSRKDVHAWVQAQLRCVLHGTPGHGAWLTYVEQGFSILQRTR